MSPTPPPSTATVPVGSAPSWAAASTPRARPEAIAEPGRAELAGEAAGEAAAGRRGHPRADDRHGPAVQQAGVAQRPDHRRRRVERLQRARGSRLADAEQLRAQRLARGELGVGLAPAGRCAGAPGRRGAPARGSAASASPAVP